MPTASFPKVTLSLTQHENMSFKFNGYRIFSSFIAQWTTDLGKQYDGRILSLKLQCHGEQGKLLNSCLHFKKSGSRKYNVFIYPTETTVIFGANARNLGSISGVPHL